VNFALIDDVIVHPSFRRKGIGTALMQKVLEKIKPLKLDFVQLHPIPGREAFFKKLGFRVIRDSRVMELPR
jgi:predicted N-acetyltransferase YhbS